jgi:hypothetical protein
MALNPLTSLSNYIRSFGQAYVYTGNPFSTGGLTALGATEGEIQVEETFKYNDLTAPEWTGDTIHTRMLDGVNVKVTIPLIFGDPTVYTKISPDGSKSGGFASPQAVVTTSVVIMPFSDIPSTLSYNGSSWSPAAPVHAVWLWRAVPTRVVIHSSTLMVGRSSARSCLTHYLTIHVRLDIRFTPLVTQSHKASRGLLI